MLELLVKDACYETSSLVALCRARCCAPGTLVIFAISRSPKQQRLTRLTVTGEASHQAPPDTAVLVLPAITQSQRAVDAQHETSLL